MDGRGNLERTGKVREKSGNLKINGYGSLQKINLTEGKGCTFSSDSLNPSPSLLGATLTGKNLLPILSPLGSKFFPLRKAPNREQILSFKE